MRLSTKNVDVTARRQGPLRGVGTISVGSVGQLPAHRAEVEPKCHPTETNPDVFVLQPTLLWVLWHGSASISSLSRMKPIGSSALQRRLAADPVLFTIVASLAAFGAYTAMYAFRKPFSAATFSGQEIGGISLKVLLVVAQLVGYTLSKFLGIKVVSEAGAGRRIALIAGLIGLASS